MPKGAASSAVQDIEPLAEDLLIACRDGDLAGIPPLLECTTPNCQSALGLSPLVAATESGHTEVLRILIKAGADVNLPTRNGNTALRAAVLLGDAEIVQFLTEQGADVDLETGRGTALLTACSQGDADMAALLLDKGAIISRESRSGTTPLIAAVREDASEVVKLLLARGADPEQATADGANAVEIAQLKTLPKTLSLLMQSVLVKQALVIIQADTALADSEKRQLEAKEAREQQHDQAIQDAQAQLADARAERDVKIQDLKAENDRLRALYGKK